MIPFFEKIYTRSDSGGNSKKREKESSLNFLGRQHGSP